MWDRWRLRILLGYNENGQVDNGDTTGTPVTTPNQLPLTNVTRFTTKSSGTTCAVADGNGFCWGANDKRQVGNGGGTTTEDKMPTPYKL